MKGNGYEQHYKNMLPPRDGLHREGSNLTSIARNKAKLSFNCGLCGMAFERYACHAKRYANHYCSTACASAAKIIRFQRLCRVCGTEMLLTPTDIERISTCSKECSRKRRIVNSSSPRSSPDYVAITKQLRKDSVCRTCGTTSGPWVAKGIRTWFDNGLAQADGSDAYLSCKQCHLESVAPLNVKSTYIRDRFAYYKEKINN